MADTKPAKPTPAAVKNAQDMYDHFIHSSKISIAVIAATLALLYVALIAF